MKKLRIAFPKLLIIAFEAVFGYLLFTNTEGFANTILMMFGIMLLAIGLYNIIRYFAMARSGAQFTAGVTMSIAVIALVFGSICTFAPDAVLVFISVIAVIYGTIVLITGVLKAQLFFQGHALNLKMPLLLLLSAVFAVAAGIVTILNPFENTEVMFKVLAAVLIAEAVIDLVALMQLIVLRSEPVPATAAISAAPADGDGPASEAKAEKTNSQKQVSEPEPPAKTDGNQ